MTEEKNSIRSLLEASREAVEASLYIRGVCCPRVAAVMAVSDRCSQDERDAIDECNITWTDPTTGETFVVDARTGNSRPQAFRHSDDEVIEELNEFRIQGRRTLPRIVESEASQVPSWITEALAVSH